MKKSISIILSIIVVLAVLLSTNFYLYQVDVNNHRTEEARYLEIIDNMEWNYIQSVITENRQKSDIMSKNLALSIQKDILVAYPNLSVLKNELDNNKSNTALTQIFKKNFEGVYMNDIANDNNDPWAAMSWGVISDYSTNYSVYSGKRVWESELNIHANKYLAQAAIDEIVAMSDKVIFWEFLKSDNPKHKLIQKMSLDDLKNVFLTEGLDGLRTYEFLSPSYITPKGDLFGYTDVVDGLKIDTDKIIIVQGFSLYDQLKKSHSVDLAMFDERRGEVKKYYTNLAVQKNISIVTTTAIIFLAIIALIFIYNKLYDYTTGHNCTKK